MNSIRRTHSAVVRLGFGTIIFLFFLPIVAPSQTLEWEVVNPFHFIRDLDAVDELREKHKALVQEGRASAHALEIALQRDDEKDVEERRKRAVIKCSSLKGPELSRCMDRAQLPYLGWFARLGRNNHAGTCWDSSALEFRDEGTCADYIDSRIHRVRVWVPNPVSTDFFAWKWENVGGSTEQCAPKYRRPICIEFDINRETELLVRAMAPDGSVHTAPVEVKDVLIAGIGDSYAAGEGNPDVPAQFLERESDTDFVWFWKFRRSARRDKVDQDRGGLADVSWLDKRCHRSMYSYQFKAALQYALEHPQKSVTFASVSCSGAEIPELIDKPQKPKEKMKGATVYQTVGDRKTIEPQISALAKVLGKRKIDYLLLSIGGNDAGFAKYVAYVMLSGKTLWLAKKSGNAWEPKVNRVETEIARVKEKYSKLGPALVSNFDFNTRSGEKPSSRIILMGYPNFLNAENGHPCKMTRNEFSMPFNRDEGRGPRLETLVTNVFGRLTTLQVTSAQTLEWTYAAPNDKKWNSHGFCAQSSPLEAEKIQERFIMPKRKKKHGWYSIEPTCPSEWDPKSDCDKRRLFDPREYKTYGHRERWVRLPVDSKLSVDQQEIVWLFSVDLLFTDDWSTVMHPTAEGFAVNADSTLEAIRNLEASKRKVP